MYTLRHSLARALVLVLVSSIARRGDAQSISAAAGIAFPVGEMGDRRAIGQQIALSIAPSYRTRGRTVRAEVAQTWFARRKSHSQPEETLSVTSLQVFLMYTAGPRPVSPYIGLGAGVCGMRISGHVNPYGTVIQVGLLLGATIGSGRIRGLVELQDQLILSDYGNSDFVASRFIPVRLGLSVRPRAS